MASLPLRLLLETVKSILFLSDLFFEASQFQWMFDVFVDLHANHPSVDDVMAQYLTIGLAKCASILEPVSCFTLNITFHELL